MTTIKNTTIAVASTLLFGGCQIGQSDEHAVSSRAAQLEALQGLDGIYVGTLGTEDKSSHFATAIVQEGWFMAFAPDGSQVYDGQLNVDGQTIHGDLLVYQGNALSRSAQVHIDGVFDAGEFINAAVRGGRGAPGEMALDYSSDHRRGASFERLADVWTHDDAGERYGASLRIDAQGVLDGIDSDGCQLRGVFSVPKPGLNAYTLRVSLANCEPYQGHYEGLAMLSRDRHDQDQLHLVITDGQHARLLHLDRRSAPVIEAPAPRQPDMG